MQTRLLTLLALTVCSLPIVSCASYGPPSVPTTPPQRDMPDLALRACALPRIPDHATTADLESAFTARGVALVACDAARQLAVDDHTGQRLDQETWLRDAADRRLSWWRKMRP